MSVVGAFAVPHPPIILPEVGRGEEKKIQKTVDSYKEAARRIADLKPKTIVLTSPHAVLYADYFHVSPGEKAAGDLRRFGVPGVSIDAVYDAEFTAELARLAESEDFPAGALGDKQKELDHGTMIPLYFIQMFLRSFKLVRIGLSGLPLSDHYRLGKYIAQTAEKLDRRVVFIASGDLAHRLREDGPYGFTQEGPEFDREIMDILGKGEFSRLFSLSPAFCEAAGECGLRSFAIMAGALDGKALRPEALSYEGTFGVGYGICAYEITGDDPGRKIDQIFEGEHRHLFDKTKAEEDPYVKLARLSLETYIKTGKRVVLPHNLPEEMTGRRAGVFVSLKKEGELRGCIGTIGPVTNSVAEEILRNAVSAGTEDPRFPAVRVSELAELVYSVDVLSEAEPIGSAEELDVLRYGVIVTKGHRRGLLLPNLEGVDTAAQQVEIAMRKAGIGPDEVVSLERFEVVRHK